MKKLEKDTTFDNWQERPRIDYLGQGEGEGRWRFKVCLASLDIMVAESSVLARIPAHRKHLCPTCRTIEIDGQPYVCEYEAVMRIFLTGQPRELEQLREDLRLARQEGLVVFFREIVPIMAETQAMEDRTMELFARAHRGSAPN